MDDGVIGGEISAEGFLIGKGVDGAGPAGLFFLFHIAEEIGGRNVHAVEICLLLHDDAQGDERDIIFLQKGGREVTGAVRADFNHSSCLRIV